jgi:Holliday junction DNA helicase RuvA
VIDHLQGELVRQDGAGVIVVRVGGLGFRVEVPAGAYAEVPLGEAVEVPTTLVFRQEGGFGLYGFSNATEREFFALLTSITGIGPKSALGILSHSNPAQLAEAIIREDISALVKVKGIGKKGAQRIIVELAEKIKALRPAATSVNQPNLFGSAARTEALEVLISLGCSREEAEGAVEMVADRVTIEEEDAADLLVMHALRALGGR